MKNKSKEKFRLLLIASVALVISAQGAIVIGCFDTNRGGAFSPLGDNTTVFRSNITAVFPTATFMSTNTLTSGFLGSVNLLIINAVFSPTQEITPLSATEQTALTNFVLAGGGLLVFADNDAQFTPASQSMVHPFNLDCTGIIMDIQIPATVTNPLHPVADGPFGMVANYTIASFPGWFDSVGQYAVPIATLNQNNQVCLAAIGPGVLSDTSGGVVFFSDSTIDNGSFSQSLGTSVLVDNAIAFAITPPPPPAHPTLFITVTNNGSVSISWATNAVGFRLQQTSNLNSSKWVDQTLTNSNQATLVVTNSAVFFRLIRP